MNHVSHVSITNNLSFAEVVQEVRQRLEKVRSVVAASGEFS